MSSLSKFYRFILRSRSSQLAVLLVAGAMVVGQGCPFPFLPGPDPTPDPSPDPTPDPDPDPVPPPGLTGQFVGATDCFICHSSHHQSWIGTRHARAYQTLVDLGQHENPVCLQCHTTGFGLEGGFVSIAATPELANVGCESCHGPGLEHRMNVSVRALRPPKSMSGEMCAQCHNDFHHPTADEWRESKHGRVTPSRATAFAQGSALNNCGSCHSGDFRQAALIEGQPVVSDALLAGVAPEDMAGISCQVCHDPHRATGNAVDPPPGHDHQLRYRQVVDVVPTSTVAAASDPNRFNLCGQCHIARGSSEAWTYNARPPHRSVQANFYAGEMPTPEGQAPLVADRRTVHRFVFKQCTTCHMPHEARFAVGDEDEVTHVGHSFAIVSTAGCSASGCHPTPEAAEADMLALQAEVAAGLADLAVRMGDPSTWQYSAAPYNGPQDQMAIPEEIRKTRFLRAYLSSDGSGGVHNPEYARAILREADLLLQSIGR